MAPILSNNGNLLNLFSFSVPKIVLTVALQANKTKDS